MLCRRTFNSWSVHVSPWHASLWILPTWMKSCRRKSRSCHQYALSWRSVVFCNLTHPQDYQFKSSIDRQASTQAGRQNLCNQTWYVVGKKHSHERQVTFKSLCCHVQGHGYRVQIFTNDAVSYLLKCSTFVSKILHKVKTKLLRFEWLRVKSVRNREHAPVTVEVTLKVNIIWKIHYSCHFGWIWNPTQAWKCGK